MTDVSPQNIVEAYTMAVKASEAKTETKLQAYDKVIAFCENNQECSLENSTKRNMLLFWAYDQVAEAKLAEKKYPDALDIWRKASRLPGEPEVKIKLGLKMLDAVDKGRFSIPEKARQIVEITGYLQKAYSENNDEAGMQRMERLQNTAAYLLGGSKLKH